MIVESIQNTFNSSATGAQTLRSLGEIKPSSPLWRKGTSHGFRVCNHYAFKSGSGFLPSQE